MSLQNTIAARFIVVTLTCLLFAVVAQAAPITEITIDGFAGDWDTSIVLHSDPSGDAARGYLDFTKGYAFVNLESLYFLVEFADPSAPVVQFDLLVIVDGRTHLVSWSPGDSVAGHADVTEGFEFLGMTTSSEFAFGEALEGRISLRDLGDPSSVRLIKIVAMIGACCDYPAWRDADTWSPLRSTPVRQEVDAEVLARDERPGHIIMADPALEAEYLYRAFIQLPQFVAIGPDGKLYIPDQLGRHVVRLSDDGSVDDLQLWRDPFMWAGTAPSDVAFDSQGNLYVSDRDRVFAVHSIGEAELIADLFGVNGFTFGPDDEIYFTNWAEGGRVMKRDTTGSVSVVAQGIENAEDLVFAPDGSLYVSQHSLGSIVKVNTSTGSVSPYYTLGYWVPQLYLAIDPEGDLWVRTISYLCQLDATGRKKPFTVNGERYMGGEISNLGLETPGGIAFDEEGRLWITSYNSSVRLLEPVAQGVPDPAMRLTLLRSGFCPGLVGGDIEADEQGNVFVYNSNSSPGEIWRITPNGGITVLYQVQDRGNVGMALDSDGRLYLGLPSGEIIWLDTSGSSHHHAWLHAWSLAIGTDGELYAAVGNGGEPRTLVRIDSRDRYTTILDEFNGHHLGGSNPYGPGGVCIDAAPEGGLYLYDGTQKIILFVNFEGNARLFSDDPRLKKIRGPAPLAVAPNGSVFVILSDTAGPEAYSLLRFSASGSVNTYARGLYGDPLAMVVSADGKWLYVAENGSVDKLPLE